MCINLHHGSFFFIHSTGTYVILTMPTRQTPKLWHYNNDKSLPFIDKKLIPSSPVSEFDSWLMSFLQVSVEGLKLVKSQSKCFNKFRNLYSFYKFQKQIPVGFLKFEMSFTIQVLWWYRRTNKLSFSIPYTFLIPCLWLKQISLKVLLDSKYGWRNENDSNKDALCYPDIGSYHNCLK